MPNCEAEPIRWEGKKLVPLSRGHGCSLLVTAILQVSSRWAALQIFFLNHELRRHVLKRFP
jgi:hypothetical protein